VKDRSRKEKPIDKIKVLPIKHASLIHANTTKHLQCLKKANELIRGIIDAKESIVLHCWLSTVTCDARHH
jgi:hypothetical protein